jgi:hypothetical protein
MIRTSQEINELNESFAKAQAKFEAAIKGSQNPAFRSKYADVSSIIDATLEHLNAEGIGVRQHPSFEYKQVGDGVEAFVTVTTRLAHKSGQWEESELSLPAIQRDRFDAQSCGSGLTYACRYAMQGIFCVRREDDDGNAATGTGSREAAQAVAKDKIADAAKKGNKIAQKALERVTTLTYIMPPAHNGNFAEFLNIPAYLACNEDKTDMLRFAFTANGAKKTKDQTTLVPAEKLQDLLTVLSGDCGIEVHQGKAA